MSLTLFGGAPKACGSGSSACRRASLHLLVHGFFPAKRMWRPGFCAITEYHQGQLCAAVDTKGSWIALGYSESLCVARCVLCPRCHWVSYQASDADCSWFSSCGRDGWPTTGVPGSRHRTLHVRDDAGLLLPRRDTSSERSELINRRLVVDAKPLLADGMIEWLGQQLRRPLSAGFRLMGRQAGTSAPTDGESGGASCTERDLSLQRCACPIAPPEGGAFVYNPSLVPGRRGSIFANVNGWRAGLSVEAQRNFSLFLEQSQVVLMAGTLSSTPRVAHVLSHAEDLRPFWLAGQLWGLFTRYRGHKQKEPWLAQFPANRSGFVHEVQLQLNGRQTSEGNWLPFAHDGRLHVSYSLCPHRVLSCEPQTGQCNVAHRTRHTGCDPRARGGASGILLDGAVVGIGHQKDFAGLYGHFLFRRQPHPPFAILNQSRSFALTGDGFYAWDRNFVLDLSMSAKGELLIAFGREDRAAWVAYLPREKYCALTEWC